MSDLDQLVQQAQQATIRRDLASQYVDDLQRTARPQPTLRRWPVWLAMAATAAATALVLWLAGSRPQAARVAAALPVRIGQQVALVAGADARYQVLEAGAATTRIAVEHGTVTARLWHRDGEHALILEGGGITARATGTIYSLEVSGDRATVMVTEGSVTVGGNGADDIAVTAGSSWPTAAAGAPTEAVTALRALAALPSDVPDKTPLAPAVDPAAAPTPHQLAPGRPSHPAAVDAAVAPELTTKERWRRARLLRSQGAFTGAVAECLTLADANDSTWSPIALLEAARIYLGPLANAEQAIIVCDRLVTEWPQDALVPEARALRCRAAAQLGRTDGCSDR